MSVIFYEDDALHLEKKKDVWLMLFAVFILIVCIPVTLPKILNTSHVAKWMILVYFVLFFIVFSSCCWNITLLHPKLKENPAFLLYSPTARTPCWEWIAIIWSQTSSFGEKTTGEKIQLTPSDVILLLWELYHWRDISKMYYRSCPDKLIQSE